MAKSSTQFVGQQIVNQKSSDLCLEQRWEQHQREVLEKFDRLHAVVDDVLGRLTRVESELQSAHTSMTCSNVNSRAPVGLGGRKDNLAAPLEPPRSTCFGKQPQMELACQREKSQCSKSENETTDKDASTTTGTSSKTSNFAAKHKKMWLHYL
eukprot:TRINITY_DN7989_c0_g1_i10.p1 TRINITY_DN7989_c0_g1~~TRINITY_DN7989_c0_g1_i10.p1  ORF type:complete len:153 (-),score=22.24 TRINITY_DN7989_c0_g1_i10:82-540(-)